MPASEEKRSEAGPRQKVAAGSWLTWRSLLSCCCISTKGVLTRPIPSRRANPKPIRSFSTMISAPAGANRTHNHSCV